MSGMGSEYKKLSARAGCQLAMEKGHLHLHHHHHHQNRWGGKHERDVSRLVDGVEEIASPICRSPKKEMFLREHSNFVLHFWFMGKCCIPCTLVVPFFGSLFDDAIVT
ncbi:hypothetical protein AMTRI_Chr10g6090 [Amborella trichopoda]